MNNPLILLLIGWFLGLISSSVGFFIQNHFERKKYIFQLKNNPTVFLYNKQSEFYEKLTSCMTKLKSYVFNLGSKLNNSDQNTIDDNCIEDLYNLLNKYSYFLPTDLWIKADEVIILCGDLDIKHDKEKINKCVTSLYELENVIRSYIGVDQLSKELLESFYHGKINNIKL